MQPSPIGETFRLLFPKVRRVCEEKLIVFYPLIQNRLWHLSDSGQNPLSPSNLYRLSIDKVAQVSKKGGAIAVMPSA